ncbi:MAG: SGNH/GDSL hydrolase family protein [Anaerolineales bacterium]|nr:SGNH/GDSL hydrolase family protein [Anaerolineales bacterium]
MRITVPACLLLAVILGSACAPVTPPSAVPSIAPVLSPGRTLKPTGTPAAAITLTRTRTPSPTVPVPEYPYIILPGSDRLREIFRKGERGGMRNGVFSKVGDSITANGYFLVPFGTGDYALGEYGYLQEVIDFYLREDAYEGNSFVHDSFSAKTSWRAEDVLDPLKARSSCEAGESPLACEFRVVRPAVAVILLGTNDAMAPTGRFQESMRRIVVHSLNRGTIPILTTLPDLRDRDVGSYNTVIRNLASQWELPLIDLSSALASLPQKGLSPDGVHLSWLEPAVFEPRYLLHGMTVRNLLTLQALDAVWRSIATGGDK